ncbi:UNVERIFIED_ORG: hypothetical protein FHW05_002339 [Pantoea agglomerans]
MKNLPTDVIECESVSVRCNDGEIFEFPVVDNKNVFPHFYRTDTEFTYQIQTLLIHDLRAMYKKHKNIAYLICAWDKKEEISKEAMSVIISDETFHYLIK